MNEHAFLLFALLRHLDEAIMSVSSIPAECLGMLTSRLMIFLLCRRFKSRAVAIASPAASPALIRSLAVAVLFPFLFAGSVSADLLPPGSGKTATIRVCGKCHSPERAASLHQDHAAWEETIAKMVKLGAQGSDDEFEAILHYLSKNFGPEVPGPINVNKANLVDLETSLLLRRSQAKAVLQYRTNHGDFRSLADLRNVPGLDWTKIETKKARIVF